jgi:uncharacterized protein
MTSAAPSPPRPSTLRHPPSHILYLHGFRSSPLSFKAQRTQQWLAAHAPAVQLECPQLPPSPAEAWQTIRTIVQAWPEGRFAVIGSSLGGFYATVAAEAFACPAVVLNPAIQPARDLARHIGEQAMFHDPQQRFFFRPEYVDELRTLHVAAITRPERYFAVIAKGDEVLDWREMHALYAQAAIRLLEGGDHALSDFDVHLPAVMAFLGLHTP